MGSFIARIRTDRKTLLRKPGMRNVAAGDDG
jgi:hypothetical protein